MNYSKIAWATAMVVGILTGTGVSGQTVQYAAPLSQKKPADSPDCPLYLVDGGTQPLVYSAGAMDGTGMLTVKNVTDYAVTMRAPSEPGGFSRVHYSYPDGSVIPPGETRKIQYEVDTRGLRVDEIVRWNVPLCWETSEGRSGKFHVEIRADGANGLLPFPYLLDLTDNSFAERKATFYPGKDTHVSRVYLTPDMPLNFAWTQGDDGSVVVTLAMKPLDPKKGSALLREMPGFNGRVVLELVGGGKDYVSITFAGRAAAVQ